MFHSQFNRLLANVKRPIETQPERQVDYVPKGDPEFAPTYEAYARDFDALHAEENAAALRDDSARSGNCDLCEGAAAIYEAQLDDGAVYLCPGCKRTVEASPEPSSDCPSEADHYLSIIVLGQCPYCNATEEGE